MHQACPVSVAVHQACLGSQVTVRSLCTRHALFRLLCASPATTNPTALVAAHHAASRVLTRRLGISGTSMGRLPRELAYSRACVRACARLRARVCLCVRVPVRAHPFGILSHPLGILRKSERERERTRESERAREREREGGGRWPGDTATKAGATPPFGILSHPLLGSHPLGILGKPPPWNLEHPLGILSHPLGILSSPPLGILSHSSGS